MLMEYAREETQIRKDRGFYFDGVLMHPPPEEPPETTNNRQSLSSRPAQN